MDLPASDSSKLLACAALPWRDGAGRLRVTAIVKATYQVRPGGVAVAAPPLPLFEDMPRDPTRPSSLVTASDLVPFKRHADVTVAGRVFPPRPGAARQLVEVAVARGAEVMLAKRLVAVGDRPSPEAPPAPLSVLPLEYERTWGGAGVPSNPVGCGLGGDPTMPGFVDPRRPRAPVGLGPIGPSWAGRAAFLPAGLNTNRLLRENPISLQRDFDVRFFQSAPQDQWMTYLRGGEHLRLVGLHPELAVVTCRLPALHAFARLDGPNTRSRAVPLVGDTLWIDMDALLACVTFRGSIEIAAQGSLDDSDDNDVWTVTAGMAPCEDVEASLASPRGWKSSTPPGAEERSISPTVDPVSVENLSGFTVGTAPWSPEPGKTRRTVIVKATLELPASGGAATIAPEQDCLRGDEYASEEDGAALSYPSDHAPFKPRADVLLRGTAHAPPGKNSALVSLSVGSLEVRVAALAPRAWGEGGIPAVTGPFELVALTYEHALGGPGFAANPAGTGIHEGSPPPRLEDPDRLLRTRADRPPPAAVGPVSPAWAARRDLAGTFDRDWQRKRWPCFPADFDPAYFQAAPARSQTSHLRGDEAFRITGVRPEGAIAEGSLPGVRPRAFVLRDGSDPIEVPLALDTVIFDTDVLRAYLVFRGFFERAGDREATRVVLFREDIDRPRSRNDLLDELCLRTGASAIHRADGRSSPKPPPSYALADVLQEAAKRASKGAGVFAAARRLPRAPVPPAPPTREEIEARLRAGQGLSRLDLSGADLRGLDLSNQDLRGALLAGAKLTGARLAGANLTGAHLSRIDAGDSVWDGADLTRADLSRARLPRASMVGVTLRQATLSGADLQSARLDAAVGESAMFVGADLKAARADGARLGKADFTEAALDDASFRGASLEDARLYEAVAKRAVFDEAALTDARFEKAVLTGASLRTVRGKGAVWECADLACAVLAGADVTGAVFAGAALAEADLRGITARAAIFRQADLTGAQLDGADLMRATFEGACLRDAVLRGASLHQAETWMALLDGADLSGAILTGSKLAAT